MTRASGLRLCSLNRPGVVRSSWIVLGILAAFEPVSAHQPHDPMNVVALSPNYAQDQTVFVGTGALTMPLPVSEYVPLLSNNAGFTFTVMPGLPNLPMGSIAVSPGYATDGTVFMAGGGGLWRSTNSGASWAAAGGTPLAAGVQSVAATPNFTTNGGVFATTAGGVFGSTDHGNTWSQLTTPSPLTSNLTVIAVSPNYAVDRTVVVGTVSNGIFISNSYGHTWALATSGLTLPQVTGIAFSPNYASDQTIFAATHGNGVYVSKNNGTTWTQVNSGITDLNGNAIALSPNFAQDSSVWVATAAGGVFRSTNGGASWSLCNAVPRPLSNQTNNHYVTLAAATGASGTVLFLGMYEGLWSSTDGGNSWQYSDTLPTRLVRDLELSPTYTQDHTVFASTYGGGTLWSLDGGQTWSFRNTGLPNSYTDAESMAPNFSTTNMAFIGTVNGLERISGGNTTWKLMTMLGKPTYPRSLGISPAFAQDSTIFIGTHNGVNYAKYVTYNGAQVPNQGLFISVNAGQNWEPTGIGGPPIDSIAVSPNFSTDKTVFAGSSTAGLFKSTDGGVTFSKITIVSTDSTVLPVAVSPAYATDQTVFAATSHSGIFKSTDGGSTWSQLPGTGLLTAFSIALSPNYASDQTLFLGTMQQGLLKSTSGGNSLISMAIPGNYASAVAISSGYAQDQTVFAASYLGLYKSTDGGSTWVYTAEPARQEEERALPPEAFYSILFQGAWTINKMASASTSQLASTTQAGATANLTFLGSGLEWIGMKSPTSGSAQVLVDGVVNATVNLSASQSESQQTLWVQRGLTCGVHTVAINAMPGAGQSVTVDALDVWQDTCPWALATAAGKAAGRTGTK
jgi:photosystem II stability/assembly factor-like uncharacterized protein